MLTEEGAELSTAKIPSKEPPAKFPESSSVKLKFAVAEVAAVIKTALPEEESPPKLSSMASPPVVLDCESRISNIWYPSASEAP